MDKYKDERFGPQTINGSSLSQKDHSVDIGDRLVDITGKDLSVLGKVCL
jgi:hypothetical protein